MTLRKKIEHLLETGLWGSRLMILLAVVASLAGAFFLMVVGVMQIVLVAQDVLARAGDVRAMEAYQMPAISKTVAAVDVFLIATVLLIFGIGLYELFVRRVDQACEKTRSNALSIRDLGELKDRLAKIVIMALVVALFKSALSLKVENFNHLLSLGGSILLSAAALFLMKLAIVKPPQKD